MQVVELVPLSSLAPCCSYAEVARILLPLISPICARNGKTFHHSGTYPAKINSSMPPGQPCQTLEETSEQFLQGPIGQRAAKESRILS